MIEDRAVGEAGQRRSRKAPKRVRPVVIRAEAFRRPNRRTSRPRAMPCESTPAGWRTATATKDATQPPSPCSGHAHAREHASQGENTALVIDRPWLPASALLRPGSGKPGAPRPQVVQAAFAHDGGEFASPPTEARRAGEGERQCLRPRLHPRTQVEAVRSTTSRLTAWR